MEISHDEEFIKTSEAIITQLGYKDIKSFIKNQALMIILAKLDKYESENSFFEKKYLMTFDEFQKKIQAQEKRENFEEEDDYLDWRFVREALESLGKKKQDMKYA
ncbi:MAG: hypothetical protein JW927_09870 [Deltaproteobacteria bacterium]|nr:hypothetical protein [Deltaproteobacteria bacterium]